MGLVIATVSGASLRGRSAINTSSLEPTAWLTVTCPHHVPPKAQPRRITLLPAGMGSGTPPAIGIVMLARYPGRRGGTACGRTTAPLEPVPLELLPLELLPRPRSISAMMLQIVSLAK